MTNLQLRRKLTRRTYRPLFEQMEDRRLLATWTVDDDFSGVACDNTQRKCETIQDAVDAASPGDTIKVNAGTYNENVDVGKKLTIQGNGNPTVDPVDTDAGAPDGATAYGFFLHANDIVIKGFHIQDNGADGDGSSDADNTVGIGTSNAFSGYKIQNNTIEDTTFGIYLNTSVSNSAKQTEVSGNTIRNNNEAGAASGNGIYSDQGARKIKISGNTFRGHDNEDVIFVGQPRLQNAITVQGNTLQDSSGIFFIGVTNSTIANNKIVRSNFNAIELAGGNVGVTIRGNNLQDVGVQGYTGIYLNDAYAVGPNTNNTIQGNTVIYDGLSGIRVRDSNFNTVKGNIVIGSSGFDLSDPAWGNGITLEDAQNNIVDSNTSKLNARHGIYADSLSSGNLIKNNVSTQNAQADPNGFDYNDDSDDGSGNPANTYKNNFGTTQNRPGLIKHHI